MVGRNSSGSEERFYSLVNAHEPAVRRFVQRRAPAGAVDDIVQETFLVALRRLDHVHSRIPEDGRRGWLCGVARMTVRRHNVRSKADTELHAKLRRTAVTTPGSANEPDDHTLLVEAALRRLDATDVDLLHAYFWDDLRGGDLATYLGVDEAAARKRRSRALQRLRDVVKGMTDDVA